MIAFAVVLAVLAIIMLIPVGVVLSYDADGLKLYAKAAFKKAKLLPKDESGEPKEKKPKKPKEPKKPKKPKKIVLELEDWFQIVGVALKALRRFKKSVCFERIRLIFISGSEDPFDTVMHYNSAVAALNSVAPLFEREFKVKKRDIQLATDFDLCHNTFELGITATIRVGQLLWLALVAGNSIAVIIIRKAISNRRERKVSHGKQANGNDAVNDVQH